MKTAPDDGQGQLGLGNAQNVHEAENRKELESAG